MQTQTMKGSPRRAVAIIGALLCTAGAGYGVNAPQPGAWAGEGAEAAPARDRSSRALDALLIEINRQVEAGVMPMPCFIDNPSPEQLAEILNNWGARPMGEFVGDQPRFWTASNQWNQAGNGTTSNSQGRPSSLTYSFVPDGTSWFNCAGGANQPSDLKARFTTAFGANNEDRGFEYIRQGLAGWRKFCGLTYTETVDDGTPNGTFPVFTTARGTCRIGALAEGANGILACNSFPSNTSSQGGDQSINSSYFTAGNFLSTTNNYRYLRNVLGHEHGHGTGAGHPVPCDNTKLMEPFINVNFDSLQTDDRRFGGRNYGDRFAGNTSAANARNFGDLTAAPAHSVLEPQLSTNGAAGANSSNQDWFRFTIDSTQDVTISATPTGGSYLDGNQSTSCSGTTATVNAGAAGNLDVTLYASDGTTILNNANTNPAGSVETIDRTAAGPNGALPAGTYYVRVIDSGPNNAADEFVQLYDFLIRVGTLKAPPKAVAGINKRCLANVPCYFMGNINSYATEAGSAISLYNWDFDGDGAFDSALFQPTFTYVSDGTYNVALRVTANAAGGSLTHTDTIQVTIHGAPGIVTSVSPNTGNQGTSVPVTITGKDFKGVTSASQVTVSGVGVTVSGTPSVNLLGTVITGLTFNVSGVAPTGARDVTITNSDGLDFPGDLVNNDAFGAGVFSVVGPPPANDECSAPGDFGNTEGAHPFDSTNATTSTSPDPTGQGCTGPISNDVWHIWTAPADGNVTINTANTSYAARVSVYSNPGCPPDGGDLIGCGQGGGQVATPVTSGQVLLIQVGAQTAGSTGPGDVVIDFTALTIACCFNDGSCTDVLPQDCTGFIGGGTCTPNPCLLACCFPDGSCQTLSVNDCNNTADGVPGAAGSSCTPNSCPQPVVACCHPDGSCTEVTAAACTGTPQPYPSSCTPNSCPQPVVACCFEDGSCLELTAADCVNNLPPGTPQAFPSTCTPNTCPSPNGICCYGAVCQEDVAPGDCTGPNRLFVAVLICNVPGEYKTPCCKADFNKVNGITVQDLFDFLSAWFAKALNSDINGNPPAAGAAVTVQDLFDFLAAWFAKGCP